MRGSWEAAGSAGQDWPPVKNQTEMTGMPATACSNVMARDIQPESEVVHKKNRFSEIMDLQTLQRLTLRELNYFVTMAEELHLGRASERVGIQESPMSRAISHMERKLGVRLFVRSSRGTRVTSTGEELLPIARQMLSDAEKALQVVHAAVTGRKGRLRVAVC